MLSPFRKFFHPGEVDCKEVRRLSPDYIEEDLPTTKRSAIHSHLSKCGPCQAFVDTLASTIGILARLPRMSPPQSLKQSIIERTTRDRGDSNPH